MRYDGPGVEHRWQDLTEFEYRVLEGGSSADADQSAWGEQANNSVTKFSEFSAPRAPAGKPVNAVRKLRSVEFFAGSGRLSFALQRRGWDVVIHDFNKEAVEWEAHGIKPTPANFWDTSFLEVDRVDFFKRSPFDYFHFSINCSSFTGLTCDTNRRNEDNNFLGASAASNDGNRMLSYALDMINDQLERNPAFLFTLENPLGYMQKHPLIKARLEMPRRAGGLGAVCCCIDYCCFAEKRGKPTFQKRTMIWTNSREVVRLLGAKVMGATDYPPLRFLCERGVNPCPCFGKHRAVCGNTQEATPFPPALASALALEISTEAAPARFYKI